jgi:hypothetical protein
MGGYVRPTRKALVSRDAEIETQVKYSREE